MYNIGDILTYSAVKSGDVRFEIVEKTERLTAIKGLSGGSVFWVTNEECSKNFIIIKKAPQLKWEPKKGEEYFFIDDESEVDCSEWFDRDFDLQRKNFLGVFPTKEAAAARVKEIKEFLKDK